MRVGNIILVTTVAVLASFNLARAADVDQTQISKMTSTDSVSFIEAAPTDAKRFLRRGNKAKLHDTDGEERAIDVDENIIKAVAANIDDLLPYVRQVNRKTIDSAMHHLQYQGMKWERINDVVNYLKLSPADRKKALLMLANK